MHIVRQQLDQSPGLQILAHQIGRQARDSQPRQGAMVDGVRAVGLELPSTRSVCTPSGPSSSHSFQVEMVHSRRQLCSSKSSGRCGAPWVSRREGAAQMTRRFDPLPVGRD